MRKVIAVLLSMSLCVNSTSAMCSAEEVKPSEVITQNQIDSSENNKDKEIINSLNLTNEHDTTKEAEMSKNECENKKNETYDNLKTKDIKRPNSKIKKRIILENILAVAGGASIGAVISLVCFKVIDILTKKMEKKLFQKMLLKGIINPEIDANSPEEAKEKMSNAINEYVFECKDGFCNLMNLDINSMEEFKDFAIGEFADSPEEAREKMLNRVDKLVFECKDGKCYPNNIKRTVKCIGKLFGFGIDGAIINTKFN